MKFIFRGHIVFEYIPDNENRLKGRVEQHMVHEVIPAFDYCRMVPEDYRFLGEFFNEVYKHTQGEEVELKDIEVY